MNENEKLMPDLELVGTLRYGALPSIREAILLSMSPLWWLIIEDENLDAR